MRFVSPVLFALFLVPLTACDSTPPEPTPDPSKATLTLGASSAGNGAKTVAEKPKPVAPKTKKVMAKPVATVKVSEDDPEKGEFTLEEATAGLPKGDKLVATIETDVGKLECTMFADKAPITVANFVGLSRGLRPFRTAEGKWEKKPAYDGTTFHRIIKGFMIQGGDTEKKNGRGEAGYVIPDEIWEDAYHDRPGLLCMANRGPNTNSAQFFITHGAPSHLDNGYTIFGECGPLETLNELANVPTRGETPEKPPVIKKITVTRK